MRFTSFSALFLGVGLMVGCGSSESPAAPAADSGPSKDAATDTKPAADTGAVSPIDISGALTITARIVTINDKGEKVAQADFPARIENPAGGWIDGKSGADGVVTFKVDAAKGPFDVTIAKKGFGVISIMGATAAVGDIITYVLGDEPSPTTNVTGTITGKQDAANKVQVDAWAFSTFVGAGAMYSSKATVDADLPFVAAAIEVDATDKILNGYLTPSQTRTSSAITANIAFPTPATAVINKTITVKFPSSGPLAGALNTVSKATSDTFLGNVLVVKSQKFAQMFVGIGKATNPAANSSTIALQVFGGDMAPDTVVAAFSGGEYYARTSIKDLADGSTTTFGNITTLEAEGTDLADLTFASDGTGYEYSEFELYDTSTGSVVWRCMQNGAKIASRKLPHLPNATKLDDVAGGALPQPIMALIHRKTATATPWSENESYDAVVSYSTPELVDPTGR